MPGKKWTNGEKRILIIFSLMMEWLNLKQQHTDTNGSVIFFFDSKNPQTEPKLMVCLDSLGACLCLQASNKEIICCFEQERKFISLY